MVYKSTGKTYDFRNSKTIRAYDNDIRNNVISLAAANLEQANFTGLKNRRTVKDLKY